MERQTNYMQLFSGHLFFHVVQYPFFFLRQNSTQIHRYSDMWHVHNHIEFQVLKKGVAIVQPPLPLNRPIKFGKIGTMEHGADGRGDLTYVTLITSDDFLMVAWVEVLPHRQSNMRMENPQLQITFPPKYPFNYSDMDFVAMATWKTTRSCVMWPVILHWFEAVQALASSLRSSGTKHLPMLVSYLHVPFLHVIMLLLLFVSSLPHHVKCFQTGAIGPVLILLPV